MTDKTRTRWEDHAERRSLVLTADEWQALEELAVKFQTFPPSGVTAGQPSWRSLVKEIARGRLLIKTLVEISPDK